MSNFVLIAICFLSGILLRKFQVVPKGSHVGINAWIIYVALPAAALYYLPTIHWSGAVLLPLLAPLLCWFGAWIFSRLLAKKLLLDKRSQAAFFIVCGLGNTSFVGFPLIKAYYGEEWLSIAALCDQVTFTLLTVGATFVAMKQENAADFSMSKVIKKLLIFPPFVAIVIALLLPQFVSFEALKEVTKMVSSTLSPLALFSVGLQFDLSNVKDDWKTISMAALYKLFIAPALVFFVALALQWKGITTKVAVFETAMGTMISAGILNDQFGLNPRLSNAIVFTTILLSFITSLIWYVIMEQTF